MLRAMAWLGVLALGGAVAVGAEPKTRSVLNKAQLTTLEGQVVPAYEQASPSAILAALGPMVARINDAQLEAVEAWLAERGIPPVGELLAGARLQLIEQNNHADLPFPKGREFALTIRGLNARLDEAAGLYRSEPAFDPQAAAPASLDEYEQRLWDMHVLENRLAAARRMAEYARTLSDEAGKLNARGLSAEAQYLLGEDYPLVLANLESMQQELRERTMELRIKRLEHAVGVLKKPTDLKERFQAAFVVDLDGEVLASFFQQLQRRAALAAREAAAAALDQSAQTEAAQDQDQQAVSRQVSRPAASRATPRRTAGDEPAAAELQEVVFCKSLADPALPSRIEQLQQEGRQAAGEEFLKKSRGLFTGLHWWYRGRYGMGTDGNGLLKSPAALKSPQAMFGLYMPQQTPQPTEPTSQGPQVPSVDRRHHYLWQFETRQIDTSSSSTSRTTRDSTELSAKVTTFDRFY